MASLRGRLTGHFLGRVFLLLVVLSGVFMAWLAVVAFSLVQYNRGQQLTPPTTMLRDAVADTTVTAGGVRVADRTRVRLERQGQWLQVIDETGTVIAEVGSQKGLPKRYSPGRLVQLRMRPAEIGMQQLFTWYGDVGGRELTFLLGKAGSSPKPPFLSLGTYAAQPTVGSTLALMAAFVLAGAAATLLVGWLSGSALARPVGHAMEWLRALASGDYREPLDRNGRPKSRGSGGWRKRPYTTYREVFDALDGLTEELAAAEAERGRLERAREEWMSGVSHDMRTPLSSVRGYAEVLASEYDFTPEDVRRHAEVIREQAAHMDALLDDLNLTFRLRADALPLARERVDLVELVRDAAVDLANDPRAEGREIVFEEAAPLPAEVDPQWFRRAVANLLVNAVVHNDAGTTVRVGVGREDGEAVVTVADDGRGMDAETVANLFDRYYRGTSTATGTDGNGLGMAIARQLVEAHGGRIAVTSAPGAGTRIEVRVSAG